MLHDMLHSAGAPSYRTGESSPRHAPAESSVAWQRLQTAPGLPARQAGEGIQPTWLSQHCPMPALLGCMCPILTCMAAQRRLLVHSTLPLRILVLPQLPVWEDCPFHGRAGQLYADSFSQLPPLTSSTGLWGQGTGSFPCSLVVQTQVRASSSFQA